MMESRIFVPAFPTIRPESFLALGRGSVHKHYPFSATAPDHFYFARNAIWHAVKAFGLSGGEVVAPAYHHGVEIEALIDAGARPRFYSIGPRFEVDLDEVESLISEDTRALYLTHFLGFPGPARAMKALAVKHRIPLIEDCALALFSEDEHGPLGITGDVSIFCLYKVLAVPDGGLLVYPDRSPERPVPPGHRPRTRKPEESGRRASPPFSSAVAAVASSLLRNVALRGGRPGRTLRRWTLGLGKQALKTSKVEPVLAGTQHFNREHASMGPSAFTRALLGAQDVAGIISRRRRNYELLLEGLRDVSPPLFETLPEGVVPLCYPMLVDDNRAFMQQLVDRGVEGVDFWREGHPSCDVSLFPDVARLRRGIVEIPCHQDVSVATIGVMVDIIRELLSAPLELRDVTERASFAALAGEWNGLVDQSTPEPFYRHEYIAAFLGNFLPLSPVRIVTGRDREGRLTAALPLVRGRGSICGIGTRELASPTNVHSLRFDLIADDASHPEIPGGSARALFRHLRADQSWDVLKLTDIPEGGKAWEIYDEARAAGFPVGAWESQRSPYIDLPPTHAELMEGLSQKFRANLRRRRKRLAEAGEITVERLTGDAISLRDLEECLVMEAAGWKGRNGSAANQSEAIHGFHRELLACPAQRARASLYRLKLSGKPIAFHYGLTSNGVFSLVMTSYDEAFRAYSPGHLLTEEVLKDCVAQGLREFDFLGCDLPWKLEWTKSVRPHHWLFIFRDNARGRLLRRIKFGWAAAARDFLSKWRLHPSPHRSAAGQPA
jgi:perosamine synthetase